MKFFCDTYALIEIIRGKETYRPYVDYELFTSLLNLFEMYYQLLISHGEITAKKYFFQFRNMVIPIKDRDIFQAAKFKMDKKKTNISYVDTLGYIMAKESHQKFLTGDKEFETLSNVEFVK
jgi:predicted nucleic acid-binding protein